MLRDSGKAGQLLSAVAMCEKLPAYWRKLLSETALIHRSAWKENSANFAGREF